VTKTLNAALPIVTIFTLTDQEKHERDKCHAREPEQADPDHHWDGAVQEHEHEDACNQRAAANADGYLVGRGNAPVHFARLCSYNVSAVIGGYFPASAETGSYPQLACINHVAVRSFSDRLPREGIG
jgi:hypothetical protein